MATIGELSGLVKQAGVASPAMMTRALRAARSVGTGNPTKMVSVGNGTPLTPINGLMSKLKGLRVSKEPARGFPALRSGEMWDPSGLPSTFKLGEPMNPVFTTRYANPTLNGIPKP